MPNYAMSKRWEKSSEFKEPFNYACGHGPLTPEEAEEWDSENGQLVFIRRIDMSDLIKLGIAEELDFMSKALVTDESKERGEAPGEAVNRAILKADNFSRMEMMINLVCGQ